ncbi:NUDIX hydrolase [Micrococcales bacterium 31B]|nr:NUDIX hydrolase [Micrococcales bacterium 31B]
MPEPARLGIAVSTVIFSLRDTPHGPRLWIPVVRRVREPYKGQWALPGGPLNTTDGLEDAARRYLYETTGVEPRYLEQLYAFGDPKRSNPRHGVRMTAPFHIARLVSVVYWALINSDEANRLAESENVRWFPAEYLPALAFDHGLIVEYALWRLRNKVEYSRIAHAVLGETFTIAQLREVHEAVLGRKLDPANFRRSMEASDALVDTGERLQGTRHRPPRLFRYNGDIDLADNGPLSTRQS